MKIEPENNTFDAIMVDVTHKCNMECANCYLPNRDVPDIEKEKLYDLVSKLPSKTFVRLIGAEPTMRDDIFEIISKIKSLGHKVSLTTNGLKLHREDYVMKLKEAGLRLVLLSMNGADDDDVYKTVDNGKYANLKVKALDNLVKNNFIVNTGTIILKNVNEHVVKKQYELISRYSGMKVKPVLRFRSMAPLGRHMGDKHCYQMNEFKAVIQSQLDVTDRYIQENVSSTVNNLTGLSFEMPHAHIRLVDWSVDDDGVPDKGNESRGRVTEDFKIAPFFEHVKENEFGY